jgi:hypothetical protein
MIVILNKRYMRYTTKYLHFFVFMTDRQAGGIHSPRIALNVITEAVLVPNGALGVML